MDQTRAFQKRIGIHVRELRIKRGVSLQAFAALCSLHRTHMSLIERGRLNIGVVTLKMIIDALEMPVFFRGME